MYFDFEGYRPETPTIESAISRREGLLFSLIVHALAAAAVMLVPQLPMVQRAAEARAAQQAELQRQQELALAEEEEERRMVFVVPRVDVEAPQPPELAFDSDMDRIAQAPERADEPTNPLPFALGNSPNPVEEEIEALARDDAPGPDPVAEAGVEDVDGGEEGGGDRSLEPDGRMAALVQPLDPTLGPEGSTAPRLPGGSLGDALRNLERYVDPETFDNPGGGAGQFGPWIQFDTRGVEFGPWIRRFVAQIRRNWFIPLAAMSMRGHVVVTFNVHKDGRITDLAVVKPAAVEAFNNSSYNALAASNPTQPLPEEYPADQAFFTVTFYYNESPP